MGAATAVFRKPAQVSDNQVHYSYSTAFTCVMLISYDLQWAVVSCQSVPLAVEKSAKRTVWLTVPRPGVPVTTPRLLAWYRDALLSDCGHEAECTSQTNGTMMLCTTGPVMQ